MQRPFSNPTSGAIRRKGLLKVLINLVLVYLSWTLGLIRLVDKIGFSHKFYAPVGYLLLWVLAVPYVLCIIGVLEMITGRPFCDISSDWEAMKPWKHKLFSFLLISSTIGLIELIACLYFLHHEPGKPQVVPRSNQVDKVILLEDP